MAPRSPKTYEDPDWENMNHTELVQLASWVGLEGVSHGISRELLISALDAFEQVPGAANPMDIHRKKLSGFLTRNWSKCEMQVPYERCPRCTLSSDAQVAKCYLENQHQIM